MTLSSLPADARLYLRPTAFVDAPFDLDGRALRLAGGLLWFSAVELIATDHGKRISTDLVPVADLLALAEQDDRIAAQLARLTAPRPALQLGERVVRLDQPQVMAILNVTPDSFSDGGKHLGDTAAIMAAATDMAAQGASIIDIGGESTRPGAKMVWEGDEIARIEPIVRGLAPTGVAMSIDTRKAAVMEATLAAGGHMINDVSALSFDDRALAVAAAATCPVVLMHHQGDPQTMQQQPRYDDPLIEVYDWLDARIVACEAAGINRSRLLVDPGIGFGKTLRHNLALLNGLSLFHALGCPIVLGASRKRIIGALSNEAPVEQRLGGSVALALFGAQQGAQLLRVHDVPETVQALKIWRGLRDEALTPIFR
jgi:dihydropteroate synthase